MLSKDERATTNGGTSWNLEPLLDLGAYLDLEPRKIGELADKLAGKTPRVQTVRRRKGKD